MMKFFFRSFILSLLCMTSLFGCASQNLLSTGIYRKQTVENRQTYFSQIWVKEVNTELSVSGRIHLKTSYRAKVPDHVEVALVDAGGKIIDSQKVLYVPSIIPWRRNQFRGSQFSAVFDRLPPAGTTIRISNVH